MGSNEKDKSLNTFTGLFLIKLSRRLAYKMHYDNYNLIWTHDKTLKPKIIISSLLDILGLARVKMEGPKGWKYRIRNSGFSRKCGRSSMLMDGAEKFRAVDISFQFGINSPTQLDFSLIFSNLVIKSKFQSTNFLELMGTKFESRRFKNRYWNYKYKK